MPVTSQHPAVHFTPPSGWMNDPNGLIFYRGEYHLFYQYHPHSLVWGPMHWGHAVSADLRRWTHLPIALEPDENGTIFSGSVVEDANNTSGLLPDGGLVAIFSFDTQAQGIAYSADNGRTWTKYAGNPVIPSPGSNFRDPKVFWYAPQQVWMMVLAVHHHVEFYSSPNLINWTQTGAFGADAGAHDGVWECPDLFPLEVNGETKWVLIVSVEDGAPAGGCGTQYFIGHFDGATFINDAPADVVRWLDYGMDNYAGVTYNNAPDGRRILLGWMNNPTRYGRVTPATTWRGMMTIPRDLSLIDVPGHGLRLAQTPSPELDTPQMRVHTERGITLDNSVASLRLDDSTAWDITATFEDANAVQYGLRLVWEDASYLTVGIDRSGTLFLDRRSAGQTDFHETFPTVMRAPLLNPKKVTLRVLVDSASIEVFADGGATVMSAQIFPQTLHSHLEVYADGRVTASALDVWRFRNE